MRRSRKKVRPTQLETHTDYVKTGCGTAYFTMSRPGSDYFEIIGGLGKGGGCSACVLQALTRVITVAVNWGVPKDEITQQLDEAYCPQAGPGSFLKSCPGAVLEMINNDITETEQQETRTE